MTQQKIQSNLPAIEKFLQTQGFGTAIQPPVEGTVPMEQLLIDLGKDEEGNDLILRLFWAQEIPGLAKESENATEPHFLQLYILFPFIAIESATKDLTSLIFSVNATLDMASFGFYEEVRLVYYRYVHVCMGPDTDAEPLLAIIASIQILIQMLLGPIKDIALGRKTLEQVRREAKESVEKQGLELP